MSQVAPTINLTAKQQSILTTMSTSRTISRSLSTRAQIILYASQGMQNKEISERVPLNRHNVGQWRIRWANSQSILLEMEEKRKTTISTNKR